MDRVYQGQGQGFRKDHKSFDIGKQKEEDQKQIMTHGTSMRVLNNQTEVSGTQNPKIVSLTLLFLFVSLLALLLWHVCQIIEAPNLWL